MSEPEDQRAQSRDAWNQSAAAWKANADVMAAPLMPVSERMLDAISPQPGHTVMELAAGTGEVGFLAAELIRPGGELICTDFSPGMLSVAQERAQSLGIDNVRFKQIDAESIDWPAATVDGVLCRFGYMLMVDPNAALRETRRVLKPGGTLALAVWGEPEANPWHTVPTRAAVERGLLEPPSHDGPGPFRWGRDGVVARELEAAGFVDFDVQPVDITFDYPSPAAWWDTQRQMSARLREALEAADPAVADEMRGALADAATEFAVADGSLRVPARTLVARAVA